MAYSSHHSTQLSDKLRLAIDIGGTFTDTVLIDATETIVASTKTLTTHENPANAAVVGAKLALDQSGVGLKQVTGFVHGTTLATNALIEKRGAIVATITTEGFRDILEIGYERRYSQYDINLEKPDFLVPRNRAFTISERVSASGEVLIDLDESEIPQLIDALQSGGITAVAICFIHAYANNSHELKLKSFIQAACPGIAVSISSEVSPEAREFDRLSTTVANAYIQPLMHHYLSAFEEQFKSEGLQCPILMMTASGGMTTIGTAARLPIRLVESGPAGGAILAAKTARMCNLDNVLSFDMGGTTAKLCLIDKGIPQTSRRFEIARAARFIKGSGMPVRVPVVDMIEIGAGGGSIASVDRLRRLNVGPRSAGSEPGPAAFGLGGKEPTVTDADIVLGYIQAEVFAEGQFEINEQAAASAIATTIGKPLSMEVDEAAEGISRIVDENMASAGRMHAVESGKDLGERTMIAFGGNGPLHACRVARAAGISSVLIPVSPGVGSAVGFLYAPVSFEIVQSRYCLLSTMDINSINGLLDSMQEEATDIVRLGATDATLHTVRTAFMRYRGQGHEIEIDLPGREIAVTDLDSLTEKFESSYAEQFSRPVPGMAIEILNWSVTVSTNTQNEVSQKSTNSLSTIEAEKSVTIYCDVDSVRRAAGVISRTNLKPGDELHGPVLITESQTTTFVASDFIARVDGAYNLVLTRQSKREIL